MTDFMLDIETLGTRLTSIPASIGVVQVDLESGTLGKRTHINIDLDDAEFYGLTKDRSTLDWWGRQAPEAKARTFDKVTAQPLKKALSDLASFLGAGSKVMWANGSDFDFGILNHAYHVVGLTSPWKYYEQRDSRTLAKLFPNVERPANNCAHDALADAEYQAQHLISIIRHIRQCQNPDGEIKRQAVVNAHPYLRGFIEARGFTDSDRVRAILVEYEKYVALQLAPKAATPVVAEDEEL